jgi:hypothetical protein
MCSRSVKIVIHNAQARIKKTGCCGKDVRYKLKKLAEQAKSKTAFKALGAVNLNLLKIRKSAMFERI